MDEQGEKNREPGDSPERRSRQSPSILGVLAVAFLVGVAAAYAVIQMSSQLTGANPRALVAAGLLVLVGVLAVRLWLTAPGQRGGDRGAPEPLSATQLDDIDAELFRFLDDAHLDDRSASLPAPEQDDRTGAP